MKSVVHLWKMEEAANAVEVDTFDYPYCANGKKGAPPKAEKLVESHREEISRAVSQHPCHPLVLVGKSMGSRNGGHRRGCGGVSRLSPQGNYLQHFT
ncbi:uncharacterized protein [Physcomitrium patens]|uniref:uncharacterized protein isoform X2 n=1 Tax=Physcomitrium patens TaxID=3218 RepID=UPI003CCD21DE